MGWWNPPGKEGATIGDEGLSETYRFLRRLSALYEEALGRKMSVDDFQATLELSLRTNGDESLFSGLEEREVTAVALKIAKRPRRQKYQPGDIFAIPLGDGQFAFGRIMSLSKRGDLVEIFRYTSDGITDSPEIVKSGRLFHPIYVSGLEVFQDWTWKIVASDPDYAPEDLDSLKFVIGAPGDLKLVQGDRQTPIRDQDAAGLAHKAFWRHEATVKRIRAALGR